MSLQELIHNRDLVGIKRLFGRSVLDYKLVKSKDLEKAMLDAIENDDAEILSLLSTFRKYHVSIYDRIVEKDNFIEKLFTEGSVDVVNAFLDKSALFHKDINKGFIIASREGRIELVKDLLSMGFKGDIIGEALIEASGSGHLELVRLLLATNKMVKGLVNGKLTEHIQKAYVAAAGSSLDIMKLLHKARGADINDDIIKSALHRAIGAGNIITFNYLKAKYPQESYNDLLRTAAVNGRTEIAKILLSKNITDKTINRAFISASNRFHVDVMKLLLNTGKVSDTSINDSIIIYEELPVSKSEVDAVKLLLKTGKVTTTKINKWFVGFLDRNSIDVAKLLLKTGMIHKSEVDEMLYDMIDNKYKDIFKMFIKNYAIPNSYYTDVARFHLNHLDNDVIRLILDNFYINNDAKVYDIGEIIKELYDIESLGRLIDNTINDEDFDFLADQYIYDTDKANDYVKLLFDGGANIGLSINDYEEVIDEYNIYSLTLLDNIDDMDGDINAEYFKHKS